MKIQYKCFNIKRKFGFELEISNNLSSSQIRDAIVKSSKKDVVVTNGWGTTTNNPHWHIKKDSTCGPNAHLGKDYGWEVASFVASGFKDLAEMCRCARELVAAGAEVNDNCGFHIHVDVKDFSPSQVGILLSLWIKIEPIICMLVRSKRLNNKHCKLWSKIRKYKRSQKYDPLEFWDLLKPTNFSPHENPERKVSLNLVNYADFAFNAIHYGSDYGGKSTLELRLPDGTLDSDEIANWCRLFLMFVENNKNTTMPEDQYPVGLDEFFKIVGLTSTNAFYLLSKSMSKTKLWILDKIIMSEHARTTSKGLKLCEEAEKNHMFMT